MPKFCVQLVCYRSAAKTTSKTAKTVDHRMQTILATVLQSHFLLLPSIARRCCNQTLPHQTAVNRTYADCVRCLYAHRSEFSKWVSRSKSENIKGKPFTRRHFNCAFQHFASAFVLHKFLYLQKVQSINRSPIEQ